MVKPSMTRLSRSDYRAMLNPYIRSIYKKCSKCDSYKIVSKLDKDGEMIDKILLMTNIKCKTHTWVYCDIQEVIKFMEQEL